MDHDLVIAELKKGEIILIYFKWYASTYKDHAFIGAFIRCNVLQKSMKTFIHFINLSDKSRVLEKSKYYQEILNPIYLFYPKITVKLPQPKSKQTITTCQQYHFASITFRHCR